MKEAVLPQQGGTIRIDSEDYFTWDSMQENDNFTGEYIYGNIDRQNPTGIETSWIRAEYIDPEACKGMTITVQPNQTGKARECSISIMSGGYGCSVYIKQNEK
ncbi:MAG: hypothetical protein NC115_04220 [Bacteroidales bacterium]|nr:hypothetical protein [Bacteroides sp.]MCM1197334.1 hypothetical protein [Clostridium sp.]MCM1501858.1 hypothetical protein [Bacteroidales bacterium]